MNRSLTAMALAGLVLAVGSSTAHAKPIEQVHFDEHVIEVIPDFCGDLAVEMDLHDQGHYTIKLTGPDRLPHFSTNNHGDATFTNLATGKAFTFTWNYQNKDVKVTDNGDGTLAILFQIPGPERIYGPDGQLLNTSGGTIRIEALVDHGGTPSDPSDDVFLGEEVVANHGGQPQDPFNFCESFHTLTAA